MPSKREQALRALLAALGTVPGIESFERNRSAPYSEGSGPALFLDDGDVEGEIDEAGGRSRDPTFNVVIEPAVFGFVEGTDETVGTKADELLWAAVKAIRSSEDLRRVVGQSGRIRFADVVFARGKAKTARAVRAFRIYLRITLSIDPVNP